MQILMTLIMRNNMRVYTNMLLELIEDGMLDKDTVIMACLQYMSEDDVKGMMRANEFIVDEDYDDSMDGDFDTAMASAGFGTDEDYGYYGDE